MRVAFVHEWLMTYAGSENVLSEMLKEFPEADLFCLVDFTKGRFRDKFMGKAFKTSFLQKFILIIPSVYRYFFPVDADRGRAIRSAGI